VVVGAAHVEGVFSLEPEDDPILLVHPNRLKTGKIVYQRVQPISRRDPPIVEFGHRVDLIQLALNDRPDRSRNPSGGLAVDPVPDIPGRVVSERPDHSAITVAHVACYAQAIHTSDRCAPGPRGRLSGKFYGELDPADPRNVLITDMQLAPKNARGKVEYVGTFTLKKPVDGARGYRASMTGIP
jgi:hypothetical protein